MPKNQVSDLITDQEITFARLILSGTMTDRAAAKPRASTPTPPPTPNPNPASAPTCSSTALPSSNNSSSKKLKEQHRQNLNRERVLARLWEIADLAPKRPATAYRPGQGPHHDRRHRSLIPDVAPSPPGTNPPLRPSPADIYANPPMATKASSRKTSNPRQTPVLSQAEVRKLAPGPETASRSPEAPPPASSFPQPYR